MDFLWFWENMDRIGLMILGIHAFAVAIVNATPTPKDDAILGKMYPVIEAFAGIFTLRAKQHPGEQDYDP